jgi:O-antigen biosynthesis protein
MSAPAAWPVAVRIVDIARPLAALTGLGRYPRTRLYVVEGGRLLGSTEITHNGAATISVSRLTQALADALTPSPEELGKEERSGMIAPAAGHSNTAVLEPSVISVIVPTCDRHADLRRCLASLTTQSTRHTLEIIVVDNRPSRGSARLVATEFPSVRVITEPRHGLSYARNAGIAAATGRIIVATDDDVTAPAGWIEKLVAPFARDEVMCVTGNVLPLELETEAQCQFEAYGGLGKGFSPFEADGRWFRSRRSAVPTWALGATANAAFRAGCFSNPAVGLLDEALGAGTPTGCSEDTYLFYRILKNGGTIVYEPSAYVWHRHRTSMESLRRQIYSYSKGHVAYHLTTLLRDGDSRALIRLLYSLPNHYLHRAWHRLRGWSEYPLSLILLEASGNLAGPWALWRSRRRVRVMGRSTPLPRRPGADACSSTSEHANAVSMESPLPQDPVV